MDLLINIFGEGKDLNVVQMTARGIVVFVIALVLIRISGRRSFGIRTPLDNIVMILLGAILSRAVVGVSPFLATVVTCAVIVLLHRLFGYLIVRSRIIGRLVEGEKILLFKDGAFIKKNMNGALVCKEDVMQGVRKTALTESMEQIDTVHMERNGEISTVKKDK